jgi:hypothetical protein
MKVIIVLFLFQQLVTNGWAYTVLQSQSRRAFFDNSVATVGTVCSVVSLAPQSSNAAAVPTAEELEKLQLGHARVRYMLDHWDEVTKICGTTVMSDTERRQVVRTEGGGGTDSCSKNPLRVQEFIGYKSVKDPLYRADKLMARASVLVQADDYDNYLDTVEQYREKADNTAMLAYTSSWGEANP